MCAGGRRRREEEERLWKELECVEVEGSVLGSVYKDVFGSLSMQVGRV